MGNLWSNCCSSEEDLISGRNGRESSLGEDAGFRISTKLPLLQSSLRKESTLPLLQSSIRNERIVRVESLSPIFHEVDYDTEDSEGGSETLETTAGDDTNQESKLEHLNLLTHSPPLQSHDVSPKAKSALRLLLNNASRLLPIYYEGTEPTLPDDDLNGTGTLKRVQRHESLSTVLDTHVNSGIFFGCFAMKSSKPFFEKMILDQFAASELSFIRTIYLNEFKTEVLKKRPDVIVLDGGFLDPQTPEKDVHDIGAFAEELRNSSYQGPIIIIFSENYKIIDGQIQNEKELDAVAIAQILFNESQNVHMLTASAPLIPPSAHSSWNSRPSSAFSIGNGIEVTDVE